MSFFDLFKKKKSAKVAKDRLSVAIALDRESNLYPHLDEMKQEIMEIVRKYSRIKDVQIKKEQADGKDILEIEVVLDK